ncbi:hypothetical protein GA0116948_10133 [Chitinophaga costaii]|uniref:DUF4397 domain-containing protein n=1 Tax=Chitinophaga costaii TaxID=1335309 RepID=A0A1C3YPY9_9BACT|nr:hypothetical protein [Chitinophaga costaii]PUZ30046.1 hypothetical protein DCM91_00770 [Chitinophaga costaii]SCB72088.1 hypothetical protein GA0116948_10133 [Chitinophaga costaii]
MFQFSYKKYFKAGVVAISMLLLGTSCKKDMPDEVYPASVTIVNGINDNTTLLSAYFGDTQPKIYGLLSYIYPGNTINYATNKQVLPVTLYKNYDTVSPIKPFLKTSLPLELGSIYTHFVYGSASAVKQMTIKEQIPLRDKNDSVAYLRIINLFDNRAIDVLQLEPVPGTMVSNLAYEQLTDFIKVPDNSAVYNFRFEVRDHATGEILATFTDINIYTGTTTLNTQWLFKARTLLVSGTYTAAGNFTARAKSFGHF